MAQGSKTAIGNEEKGVLYEVHLITLSQLASEFCNNYDNWDKINPVTKATCTCSCFSSVICKYNGIWLMVAPAFAMASDVPPVAKLPHSTDSTGSADVVGFSSTDTFPKRQIVVPKYFLGSKHMLVYHSYVSEYSMAISVCTQCIKKS